MEEEGNDVANSQEWKEGLTEIITITNKEHKGGTGAEPALLMLIAGILVEILKELEDK